MCVGAGQVKLLEKYLPLHDWVAWVDCDSFLMNDTLAFTDVLPDPALHPNTDLVISMDGIGLNSGTTAMRRRGLTQCVVSLPIARDTLSGSLPLAR